MTTRSHRPRLTWGGGLVLLLALAGSMAPAAAQQGLDDAEVHVLPVQGNVYMLVGAGGNITVQVGRRRRALSSTRRLRRSATRSSRPIRTLSNKPIRYIINTHVHPDHIGGNEALARAGRTIAGGNVVGDRARTRSGRRRSSRTRTCSTRMSAPTGQRRPDRRRVADRHLLHRRRRSCSSTARPSRSCTSRRRTPTATASCSSGGRTC